METAHIGGVSANRTQPGAKRRKRRPDEAMEEALTAARQLLLAHGPAAVTLANVGREIGMSHTNVIHHFGSAAGLQSALMGSMIRDLTAALDTAVSQLQGDAGAIQPVIERVFTAFDEGGAGQLAAWIALSRDFEHLNPVRQAVLDLVAAVQDKMDAAAAARIRAVVYLIAICAFGDAVIGPPLREMLEQPDETGRALMAQLVPALVMQPG